VVVEGQAVRCGFEGPRTRQEDEIIG